MCCAVLCRPVPVNQVEVKQDPKFQLRINEVAYSGVVEPFLELVKDKESTWTIDDDPILGNHGVIIAEYDRQAEKSRSMKLRALIDLKGTIWESTKDGLPKNWFVIGPQNGDFNMNEGKPNVMRRFGQLTDNWLQPPAGSFLFVIITYSKTESLFAPRLLKEGMKKYLGPELLQYVYASAADLVILGGSSGDKGPPVQCAAPRFLDFHKRFFPEDPDNQYVTPTIDLLKSINRCGPGPEGSLEPFDLNVFKPGKPTQNKRNNCKDQYNNPEEMANNPDNYQLSAEITDFDACEGDHDMVHDNSMAALANVAPVFELIPEKIREALLRNSDHQGICPPSDKLPRDQAGLELSLAEYDKKILEFDQLYTEKMTQHDDLW